MGHVEKLTTLSVITMQMVLPEHLKSVSDVCISIDFIKIVHLPYLAGSCYIRC